MPRHVLPWPCFGALVIGLSMVACYREPVDFPQGVAIGDVTATSAVVWTRTAAPARLEMSLVEWEEDHPDPQPVIVDAETHQDAVGENDLTAQFPIDELRPDTFYGFVIIDVTKWPPAFGTSGTFRTAPAPDQPGDELPRFVVGGDVGGQGFCRDPETGYDIYRSMLELDPHFFIANGDMIYADGWCPAEGPEGWKNLDGGFGPVTDLDWRSPEARENILAHWRYNRADPHAKAFYAKVPVYAQWDDHEVVNDFGAPWDRWPLEPARDGFPQLVNHGLDAFFAWNPIRRHPDEPRRIYRSFHRGAHLDLFLLDARSYRDANATPDSPEKTLLGAAQKQWLIDGLTRSTATWKVVSSDVPLSIPTGWPAGDHGRDSFADGTEDDHSADTGWEIELLDILHQLDAHDVRNLVVVATDVHFAANLRYDRDFDGDGDTLRFHELISGPMNAVAVPPKTPDPTLEPDLLWSDGEFFNFSFIRLEESDDGTVRMVAEIRNRDGSVRPGSRLEVEPQAAEPVNADR